MPCRPCALEPGRPVADDYRHPKVPARAEGRLATLDERHFGAVELDRPLRLWPRDL